jgi:hypothetical protein
MKSTNSASSSFWVVTIHDMRPQGHQLSFDTKEVLVCLGPGIHSYLWAITDLDCTGEEAQPFCDAVEKGRRSGQALLISWDELFAACQKFGQTVEATIIGSPQKAYTTKVLDVVSDLSLFPKSGAELIIRAIDSSFFEVITKRYAHVESLKKCFRDVREEDPTNYFATSVNRGID